MSLKEEIYVSDGSVSRDSEEYAEKILYQKYSATDVLIITCEKIFRTVVKDGYFW